MHDQHNTPVVVDVAIQYHFLLPWKWDESGFALKSSRCYSHGKALCVYEWAHSFPRLASFFNLSTPLYMLVLLYGVGQ